MSNNITIIDSKLKPGESRLINSMRDELGFNIINKSGTHLFIEPKYHYRKLIELVIKR